MASCGLVILELVETEVWLAVVRWVILELVETCTGESSDSTLL
jgi:hypothetical protein